MRLERIQDFLKGKTMEYQYTEIDGCGSLDFEYRGISYHIWEYEDNGWGAETNVKNGGYNEDMTGDYQEEILRIIRNW